MISIIVPVYNAEKYLKECMESLITQEYSDFEVILVDDGSTDSSPQICDYYCERFKNVQVIHQFNSGVSSARQNGVNIAKGEWIVYVDADDSVAKNMCLLVKDSICDADVIMFSNNYEKIEFYLGTKEDLVKTILGYAANDTLSKSGLATVWGKAYRKNFLIENKIIFENDISNGEDMLYNIRVVINAKKIKFINESFYFYRENFNSVTHSYSVKVPINDRAFLEKLEVYIRHLFSEKEFYMLYNDIVLNGLVICLRRYFSHKENSQSFWEKKQELNEFTSKYPYNVALEGLKPHFKNLRNSKKLILFLLKCKFTIPVLFLCSIQKKYKETASVIEIK